MMRASSRASPARGGGGGGLLVDGEDPKKTRKERRKRQLLLDVFVFLFVGLWVGFAVHSHFTVGRLHEESDARTSVHTMIIEDKGPKQGAAAGGERAASRGEAAASAPGKALSSAGWEWDEISGLFGSGGGKLKPDPNVRRRPPRPRGFAPGPAAEGRRRFVGRGRGGISPTDH